MHLPIGTVPVSGERLEVQNLCLPANLLGQDSLCFSVVKLEVWRYPNMTEKLLTGCQTATTKANNVWDTVVKW